MAAPPNVHARPGMLNTPAALRRDGLRVRAIRKLRVTRDIDDLTPGEAGALAASLLARLAERA